MKKLFVTITLLLVLSVGNLFAYDYKVTKKSGNVTYLWDLDATTPVAPSSKELNNWISEAEKLGFECIVKRAIPLSEALEKHTEPIDEVLLARRCGCYSVGAAFENDFCLSLTCYFVSKKDIVQISFVLTK